MVHDEEEPAIIQNRKDIVFKVRQFNPFDFKNHFKLSPKNKVARKTCLSYMFSEA